MSVVMGTAGHIDHGKTTLVKALTGVDTDRLPDEKRRGITIDIGFAELRAGERSISFIDVPGHERFVRNMLAGASGIDAVMLVVAADDGVMPQTREHFEICRLLGVEDGVIVITKASLAESSMIDLVRDDVADLVNGSFLANARIFVTDARSGRGIDDLREDLLTLSRDREESVNKAFRLPIDRVFSQKGFGTIVTGTLTAGEVSEGDEVEIYPLERTARVRGLQNHDRDITKASAGMRVAVNLAGLEKENLARGLTVGAVDAFLTTAVFDASVEVCGDVPVLKDRQRVRVHVGTDEVMARVSILSDAKKEIEPGGRGLVRFRLERDATLIAGERFIIRSYSPVDTIAGGTVLDPRRAKLREKDAAEFLNELSSVLGDTPRRLELLIRYAGKKGVAIRELAAFSGDSVGAIKQNVDGLIAANEVVECGEAFVAVGVVSEIEREITDELKGFHAEKPLAHGCPLEGLRERVGRRVAPNIFRECLSRLVGRREVAINADLVRLAESEVSMSAGEQKFCDELVETLVSAGLDVPKQKELIAEIAGRTAVSAKAATDLVRLLLAEKTIVKVSDDFYFSRNAIDALVEKLRGLEAREIDVPKFKDVAGVSRKYAIPLLEYFDREKITARRKDGSRVVL